MEKNLIREDASQKEKPLKQKVAEFLHRYNMQLSITGIVLLLFTIFIIIKPNIFLSHDIYYAFMSSVPFVGITALALTFITIIGEIDLSFPSVMGFGGWIFASIFMATGNIYLAMFTCLIGGAFIGLLNGILVTKVRIPSLVATIGTQYFWRGVIMVLCGGKGIPLVVAKKTVLFNVLVGRFSLGKREIPVQIVWFIVVAIILWFLLNRHRFGGHVYCVGDNLESARMMGINVDRIKILVFVLTGILAVFSGVLASLEVVYLWPTLGDGYLIRVLAAVYIGGTSIYGGTGTIFGTVIGAILIGILEGGIIAMGITGFWTQLVYGVVIVASLSIYSYLKRS
ncbi:MAG: ABC transporter permease [Candidatus Humimicrobiaceae bacterium]